MQLTRTGITAPWCPYICYAWGFVYSIIIQNKPASLRRNSRVFFDYVSISSLTGDSLDNLQGTNVAVTNSYGNMRCFLAT